MLIRGFSCSPQQPGILEANLLHLFAYGRYFNLGRDVEGEGFHQHDAGSFIADTTGLEVEERFFAHLSDGGTVAAFHVVRKYFQLRFGVNVGVQDSSPGCCSAGKRWSSVHLRVHRSCR